MIKQQTKIFLLRRDLNYIRTFTRSRNNVPKFNEPDNKYSYLEDVLLFSSRKRTAGRRYGPTRGHKS